MPFCDLSLVGEEMRIETGLKVLLIGTLDTEIYPIDVDEGRRTVGVSLCCPSEPKTQNSTHRQG